MLKQFFILPALLGVSLAIGFIVLQQWSPNSASFTQTPFSFAEAASIASPSVVNLYDANMPMYIKDSWYSRPEVQKYLRQEDLTQRHRRHTSLGSGVIVNKEGYFLTNYHVVAKAKQIVASLPDGRETLAQWVGFDPETDLAVLKISLPNLNPIQWATQEILKVGDSVLAIGNPFGIGQTVTRGVVSAVNRSGLNLSTFESFIQTDAAINPGNSGGALVDVYGNLVGINTALFSRSGGSQGIGFAIPTSIARKVLEDIVKHGHVIRGWLGIYTQPMGPSVIDSTSSHTGLLISGVAPSSPAEKAGIRVGDILAHINNTPTVSQQITRQTIANFKPNTVALLGIKRGKIVLELEATIALRHPIMNQPNAEQQSE